MKRTMFGNVPAVPEVMVALAGQAWMEEKKGGSTKFHRQFAAQLLLSPSVRPCMLTDDNAWATILALAYLRKHMSADRDVWSGLEAKALEWITSVWPVGVGRSVGSLVLAAMRLV